MAMLRRERAFARVHRVDMGTNDALVRYTPRTAPLSEFVAPGLIRQFG